MWGYSVQFLSHNFIFLFISVFFLFSVPIHLLSCWMTGIPHVWLCLFYFLHIPSRPSSILGLSYDFLSPRRNSISIRTVILINTMEEYCRTTLISNLQIIKCHYSHYWRPPMHKTWRSSHKWYLEFWRSLVINKEIQSKY